MFFSFYLHVQVNLTIILLQYVRKHRHLKK